MDTSVYFAWLVIAATCLFCGYIMAREGYHAFALALVLGVCLTAPAEASENPEYQPIDLEGSWLDFGDFDLPTVLEPLKGNTKIFLGEAYSHHFNTEYDRNEVHSNYGFEYKINEKWGFGINRFKNSFYVESYSAYAVYDWYGFGYGDNIRGTIGVQAGIADGYEELSYSKNGFIPVIAPFVDLTVFQSVGSRISVLNTRAVVLAFYLEF